MKRSMRVLVSWRSVCSLPTFTNNLKSKTEGNVTKKKAKTRKNNNKIIESKTSSHVTAHINVESWSF